MKSNFTNTQGLFEKTRKAPTELSHSEVELMIKNFPTLSPTSTPPSTNIWSNLFNLNNWMMLAIPVAIVSVLTFTTTDKAENASAASITNLSNKITNHNVPVILNEVATFAKEKSVAPIKINNNKVTNSNKVTNTINTNKLIVEKSLPQNYQIVVADSKKEVITNSQPSDSKNNSEIYKPKVQVSHQTIPDLSNSELKQLKRNLYKQIVKDKLVADKSEFVKIELPGDKIKINDQLIPNNLMTKYAELTMLAGIGPNRRIEMNQRYIKVGDFTKDGFKGVGFGKFTVESSQPLSINIKEENKKEFKDDLISEFQDPQVLVAERKSVFSFASKISKKSAYQPKGKALFPVKMKEDMMQLLHEELYAQLLLDNLINSNYDYVYIQLPRYDIAINGKKLQVPLPTKYLNIVESYKIKHGGSRAILLSKNTISVGDYINGEFTGTTTDIIN